MSDTIPTNELLKSDIEELESLTSSFKGCLEATKETLISLTNEPEISYSEPVLSILPAGEFDFKKNELLVRIGIKTGIIGYSFLNLSQKTCESIAALMMGMDDASSLSEDIVHSAICEAMNQTMGSFCVTLARSVGETVDISIPDVLSRDTISFETLFNGAFKPDTSIYQVQYTLQIGELPVDLTFVFILNIAKSASFKIKTTESKNLLRLNPDLAKTIAEYFTLLGVKYKTIYSMLGVMDDVSVLELNSIHSLQCLDVGVINNYNILNKNKALDLYNIFIFEQDFVTDVKKVAGLLDEEDSTWDILKELNNQFSYIFLEYCSDSSLVFDSVECNNFLELPDNQYLLISFSVGDYKFYQLLSFALIDKIKMTLSKSDKEKIKDKTVENLTKVGYNSETDSTVETSTDVNSTMLPAVYRNIPFDVSGVLAEKEFTIGDLLRFSPGYIIHFDRKIVDNIDIHINNIKKAEGEVGELTFNKSNNYAIKIKKIQKE